MHIHLFIFLILVDGKMGKHVHFKCNAFSGYLLRNRRIIDVLRVPFSHERWSEIQYTFVLFAQIY